MALADQVMEEEKKIVPGVSDPLPGVGALTGDEGFSNGKTPYQQQQTDANSGIESIAQEGTVSKADLEKKAESQFAREQVREVYKSIMSEDDITRMEQGQMKIKELVSAAEKVNFRVLHSSEDFDKMSEADKKTFSEALDKKMILYDKVKRFTGVNIYNIETNWTLRKAKKIKGILEGDITVYEKELNGRTYRTTSQSDFYDQMIVKLPESVKNDPQLEDLMQYLNQNAGKKSSSKGLKGVRLELAKKVRIQGDIDDLLQAQVAEYGTKLKGLKDEIDDFNRKLAADPQNKGLVEARMEKNALFNSYIEEKTKLEEAQDRVLDQFLEAKDEYDFICHDIDLKESTVYDSKDTLRDLRYGIRTLESHLHGKSEIIRVGNTIMVMTEARSLAKKLGVGGYMRLQLTKGMQEAAKATSQYGSGPIRGMAAAETAEMNLKSKEQKRHLVEIAKQEVNQTMYNT